MDKVNKNHQISTRIYDLIYELNLIYPSLLLQVLPQLECKLKTGSEPDRQSKCTASAMHCVGRARK